MLIPLERFPNTLVAVTIFFVMAAIAYALGYLISPY